MILTIKNRDMVKLSGWVHPKKGLRFSPYAYVDIEKDLVFSASRVRNLLQDQTPHMWGTYDGSGLPIKLTFKDYYDRFVYGRDFAHAKETAYNRIIGRGNTVNNNFEAYPNSIIVEYHFPGFDPKVGGLDWESLRLVFKEKNARWYLVEIIHDQWTI